MSIVKAQTEYTINSMTVTEETSTSTNGCQVSIFRENHPCNLSLKLDAYGNPISLVVKQDDIPALVKTLSRHIVHLSSDDD